MDEVAVSLKNELTRLMNITRRSFDSVFVSPKYCCKTSRALLKHFTHDPYLLHGGYVIIGDVIGNHVKRGFHTT